MLKKTHLIVETKAKTLHKITKQLQSLLSESDCQDGLCNVFIQHTSASLIITENADPDVLKDLEAYFLELIPESRQYIHNAEGKDDMPAHIRNVLTQNSISIPFKDGRLQLGTWQGVYLWEHRDWSHSRKLIVSFLT